MPTKSKPIQTLKAKRIKVLKAQRDRLVHINTQWLEVANLDNPLHAEYDRQVRAARVTLNTLLKHAEEL